MTITEALITIAFFWAMLVTCYWVDVWPWKKKIQPTLPSPEQAEAGGDSRPHQVRLRGLCTVQGACSRTIEDALTCRHLLVSSCACMHTCTGA